MTLLPGLTNKYTFLDWQKQRCNQMQSSKCKLKNDIRMKSKEKSFNALQSYFGTSLLDIIKAFICVRILKSRNNI